MIRRALLALLGLFWIMTLFPGLSWADHLSPRGGFSYPAHPFSYYHERFDRRHDPQVWRHQRFHRRWQRPGHRYYYHSPRPPWWRGRGWGWRNW